MRVAVAPALGLAMDWLSVLLESASWPGVGGGVKCSRSRKSPVADGGSGGWRSGESGGQALVSVQVQVQARMRRRIVLGMGLARAADAARGQPSSGPA